jgi:hypothetical protein
LIKVKLEENNNENIETENLQTMSQELQAERQRLIDLGCVEFKTIASKVGQKYRNVCAWQASKVESSPVLEVVGYWQVENGNGYRVSVYGGDLVMLTDDDREPDIYTQHGFDMAKHRRVLLEDVA